MKKALVALALAGLASTASAAVANSRHDLSNSGPWATLGGTLSACQYCHAPHNVNTAVGAAPLWNRNSYTTSYQLYTSATLRNTRATSPNANTLTCLSCHDGVADLGATYTGARGFSGAVYITNAVFPAGPNGTTAANLGQDLRDDHPVSIRYVYSVNSLGQTVGNYAATNTITAAGIRLYTYGNVEYVECASCHDPHNYGATADFQPFLRVGKSVICTTCHLY